EAGFDLMEAVHTIPSPQVLETDLHITKLGHRNILWNAIRQLQSSSAPPPNLGVTPSHYTLFSDSVVSDPPQQKAQPSMELIKKIGQGSFSEVYLGKWKGKDAAIKQITKL